MTFLKSVRFVFFLLFVCCVKLQAQSTPRLTSSNSYLDLSKATWHLQQGDNSAWKGPDFNDRHWPTSNWPQSPHIENNLQGIYWFRVQFLTDNSCLDHSFELQMKLVGACEIYLDGRRVGRLGNPQKNKNLVAINKYITAAALPFERPGLHLLAIRYSFPDIHKLQKQVNWRIPLYGFEAQITPVSFFDSSNAYAYIFDRYFLGFYMGLFLFFLAMVLSAIGIRERLFENLLTISFILNGLSILLFVYQYMSSLSPEAFVRLSRYSSVNISAMTISLAAMYYLTLNTIRSWLFKIAIAVELSGLLFFLWNNSASLPLLSLPLKTIADMLPLFLPTSMIVIAWQFYWGKGPQSTIVLICLSVVYVLFVFLSIVRYFFFHDTAWLDCVSLLVPIFGIVLMMNRNSQNIRLLNQKLREIEKLSAEKQVILQIQNVQLEKRVKERTAQLQTLNATKDRLFSIISHDLRSPILSLKTLLELINDKALKKEDFHRLVFYLSERVGHLHETLDNLLKWSLVQMKALRSDPHPWIIKELIVDTINLLDEVARTKKLHFVVDVPAHLFVFSDKNLLKIVLRNIVQNAIKFSYESQPIKITASQINKTSVQIIITDYGIGMDTDKMIHLSKTPEFTSYTTNNQGTGLGLVLAKELLEIDNGEIHFKSTPGKGTTVTLTLLSTPVQSGDD